MFIVKYYVIGAILSLTAAVFIPTWYFSFILAWIGISLTVVSIAYISDQPRIFRKKLDGSIPWYISWLLTPFLVGSQLYNAWARKNDSVPAIQKVAPNVYLACRLFPSDIDYLKHQGVAAILDATAEFSGLDWSANDNNLHYLNVPILDHKAPHKNDLKMAVNWISHHIENDRAVAVHCALGRGRSVLIVAAYLLASKQAKTVEEAMQTINQIRSTAKLNSYQYRKLDDIQGKGILGSRKSLLIIANPVSGGGKFNDAAKEIQQRLSLNYKLDIHLTSPSESAFDLVTRYKKKRHFAVIACGGDGTVNEVARALVNDKTPLGIIPLGTTNALGHVLYGNLAKLKPIEVACDIINQGEICQIDTAQCNDDIMLLVAGVGFEQRMITHASRGKKDELGQFAYVQALASAIMKNESASYTVQIDNNAPRRVKASSLVVANAAPFSTILAQGKGEPNPRDGKLDMTVVNTSDSLVVPIASLGLKSVTQAWLENEDIQGVEHRTLAKVSISSDKKLDYVVDGEVRSSHKINISVNPDSLNVLCEKST